jgi:hypothetical protein
MKYRKRFGRWGEAAVARAFRDRGVRVETAEGLNRLPGRDMTIGFQTAGDFDVQVKSTNRESPADCFQIHWEKVKEYLEFSKIRGFPLILAVVNLRRRAIYLFGHKFVERVCSAAEKANGDHYSNPGALYFEYEESQRRYDLTVGEVAEGTRIAEDEGDDIDSLPGFPQ